MLLSKTVGRLWIDLNNLVQHLIEHGLVESSQSMAAEAPEHTTADDLYNVLAD